MEPAGPRAIYNARGVNVCCSSCSCAGALRGRALEPHSSPAGAQQTQSLIASCSSEVIQMSGFDRYVLRVFLGIPGMTFLIACSIQQHQGEGATRQRHGFAQPTIFHSPSESASLTSLNYVCLVLGHCGLESSCFSIILS